MQYRKINFIILIISTALVIPSTAIGAGSEEDQGPWERYALRFGGFYSTLDTSFRVGAGIGVDIDMEELLDMDSTTTVFKVGGLWRFSDNKKHRLDLSWFAFRRTGSVEIDQTIEIEDRNGDTITLDPGTDVDSFFNIDIYQLSYSYSFLQDDRVDLAAQFGFYVMPMEVGIEVSGLVDEEGTLDFTAPLPTLGLRMDFVLTPNWYFRSGSQIFYLEYEQFKGSVLASHAAVEYVPWEHVGIGLGVESFRFKAESDGEDYPEIDFKGSVEFTYVGVELYTRIHF